VIRLPRHEGDLHGNRHPRSGVLRCVGARWALQRAGPLRRAQDRSGPQTVRFIAPFAPEGPSISLEGCSAETVLAPRQQIIIDNRAGAGGNIGTARSRNLRRTLYRADHFIAFAVNVSLFPDARLRAEPISFRP